MCVFYIPPGTEPGVRTVEITRVSPFTSEQQQYRFSYSAQYLKNVCTHVLLFQGPTDALGVSIAGGKGSPLGDIPIFIAMIQANGVAARTHRLKVWHSCLSRSFLLLIFHFCPCVNQAEKLLIKHHTVVWVWRALLGIGFVSVWMNFKLFSFSLIYLS